MKIRKSKLLKYLFIFFIATTIAAVVAGCAGIEPPTPDEMMKRPLGKSSLKVGMTKDQVESMWGKPDEIRSVENKEKWKGSRVLWVYRAKASGIPLDVDYLSNTRKLYFDGDNLTNIE